MSDALDTRLDEVLRTVEAEERGESPITKLEIEDTEEVDNDSQDDVNDTDEEENEESTTPTDPKTEKIKPTKPVEKGTVAGTNELEEVKARWIAEHPELEEVLKLALKEMDRGVQKVFRNVDALKKQTAEEVVHVEKIKHIPTQELDGMVYMHQVINNGTPQEREALANWMYTKQEELRSNLPTNNPNAAVNDPRITQIEQHYKELVEKERIQKNEILINEEFRKLEAEYGNRPIPQSHKDHVLNECRTLGFNTIGAVSTVWRSEYGVDYAKSEAVKKKKIAAAQKAGMSVSGGNPANPSPVKSDKKKSLDETLNDVCDAYGFK